MFLTAGTELGSFEIVRLLGSGGMADVYLALDRQLNRRVAVKMLRGEVTTEPHRLARIEQEARAASALSHPNICHIYHLGETIEGQRYIAMEYVEGETLHQRLTTTRLTLRETLDIAIQMAAALAAAHAAGIVHRDINPANVIVRPDRLVKVLDFGLAKLVPSAMVFGAAGPIRTLGVTEAGSLVGTIDYMSPEQARGQQVDARTDVWALGVVLYEMVAGRPPFAGATRSDVLAAILEREPAPLHLVAPRQTRGGTGTARRACGGCAACGVADRHHPHAQTETAPASGAGARRTRRSSVRHMPALSGRCVSERFWSGDRGPVQFNCYLAW